MINPNGIIFGKGASLDLNGSFTATTADSILFPGYEFSALNPKDVPTLTIDVPLGVKFSHSNGQIIVRNDGYTIYQPNTSATIPPIGTTFPPNGLQVKPGKSISLIASNIIFDGGVINTLNSSIILAAISKGNVSLANTPFGLAPTFSDNTIYGNISFTNHSLILNTSIAFASINIFGSNINLIGGSSISLYNLGSLDTGNINIFASKNLTISGTPQRDIPDGFSREISGIISSTFSEGKSGDINIKAENLRIENTGIIASSTYSIGNGGDINLDINKSIQVIEFDKFPTSGSLISTYTTQSGIAGNININTNSLVVNNGAFIVSTVLGNGKGGNINIEADTVLAKGYNSTTLAPSIIASFTASEGNGGDVNIKTDNLVLVNGGRIDASTLDSGNAGSVNIFANNIFVSGTFPSQINGYSLISSSGNSLDPITKTIFLGIDLKLTGNAGDVFIDANNIFLDNGGQVSVKNDGPGNAGNLKINANSLYLRNGAISASTQSGDGGNTEINTEILILRNSRIDSSAKLSGNGGNTTIVAKSIAGDYQSAITANAEQGFGGNINIDTLALVFPLSNITASSQKGIDFDGSINIKSVEFTRIDQTTKQPIILRSSFPEICNSSVNKRNFLITAADIPDDIDDLRETDLSLSKVPYSIDNKTGKKILDIGIQGWVEKSDGKGETIAFNNLAFGGSYLVNACRELSKSHAVKN